MLPIGEGKVQVLFGEGKSTEGGTVRKLLLLAALCMVGALVFAPAAMAQEDVDCDENVPQAQEQAILDADPSDPNGLDGDDDGIACEEPGNDEAISVPTEEQYDNDDGADEAQYDDDVAVVQYDDESATPTATVSASASPLPDTGGVAPPAALAAVAALLLVGSGIVSASVIRRR